jgi:hypothetical protein
MEVDKDHIHLLIDYLPTKSLTQIVSLFKPSHQCACGESTTSVDASNDASGKNTLSGVLAPSRALSGILAQELYGNMSKIRDERSA